MNKLVIVGVIVIIIIFAIFYLIKGSGNISGETISDLDTFTLSSDGAKEFSIIAKKWKFSPNKIEVNKGDTVILNVKSIDVSHGFAVPSLGINEFLSPGNTVKIEFVANREGTFVFACSVSCGVGHTGMSGKIIVK